MSNTFNFPISSYKESSEPDFVLQFFLEQFSVDLDKKQTLAVLAAMKHWGATRAFDEAEQVWADAAARTMFDAGILSEKEGEPKSRVQVLMGLFNKIPSK